jgi:hypothetical protein
LIVCSIAHMEVLSLYSDPEKKDVCCNQFKQIQMGI